MKILYVRASREFNFGNRCRALGLTRALKERGIDSEIAFFHNKRGSSTDSIGVSRMNIVKHPMVFLKNNADAVHINGTLITSLGNFWSRLKRTPVFYDRGGDKRSELLLENKKRMARFYSMLDTSNIKRSRLTIAVSRKMQAELKRKHPHKSIEYIPNGVDLERFNPGLFDSRLKKSLGLAGKFIVGYVGGMQVYQGIGNLIKSMELVGKEAGDVALLVVGAGNDEASRRAVKELGLKNVLFYPKQPWADIPRFLSICNALTIPRPCCHATDIAAPTKFSEYCAMGKPVLVTNTGDAADMVRGYRSGLVVENDSPKTLAQGMLKLRDSDLKRMGRSSRKVAVKEFDWKEIGRWYVKIIERELS